jgi:hypothetical protein
LLRLACLALIAVLATGCAVTTDEYTPAPDETEEVIDEEAEGTEEEEEAEVAEIAVCVDKDDQTRADYRPCEDETGGFAWYFYTETATIPAVGQKVSGGTYTGADEELTKAAPKGGLGTEIAIETPSEWVEVCVKKPSRLRVVNNFCEEQQSGYGWYYIAIDGFAPAVGKRADHGSFRFFGGDTYRARQSGGDAVDAAIEYEEEVVEE